LACFPISVGMSIVHTKAFVGTWVTNIIISVVPTLSRYRTMKQLWWKGKIEYDIYIVRFRSYSNRHCIFNAI
jgi:hypothetical protein